MNWILFAKVIATGVIAVIIVSFLCFIWLATPKKNERVKIVIKESGEVIFTFTTDKLIFKDGYDEASWNGLKREITIRKEDSQ